MKPRMIHYLLSPPELEAINRQTAKRYEFTPVGYFMLDQAGCILEADASGSRLLKLEQGALIGSYFSRFLLVHFRDEYFRYRRGIFEKNAKAGACEVELRRGDGTLFFAQLHSAVLWDSQRHAHVEWMTVTDITECKQARSWLSDLTQNLEQRIGERTAQLKAAEERRRAELAARQRVEHSLRESESRFRDFAEAAADWFWEMGPDLRFTFLAGRYQEVMGLCSAQLLGRTRQEIYADQMDDAEKWAQHFSVLEARSPFEGFEFKWVCPDGTGRLLRLSGQPMVDNQGQFQGYRGVGQDVTQYKRVEEQSRQRWTELARFSHSVLASEMASTLLHELNQPLGAITNYCAAVQRMLHAGAEHSPLFAEAVAQAARQAQRAAAITHRLRALLHVGRSQPTAIHLNDLIKEIVALVEWEAQENRLVIETQLQSSLPAVVADRLQIEQVILNLLRNGMEAMELTEDREKRLIIRTSVRDAQSVQAVVEDRGPGIDQAVVDRLFDAFYTTKAGGLGLGLAISRSIIEGHGGQLWAKCGSASGSKFYFTLPTE